MDILKIARPVGHCFYTDMSLARRPHLEQPKPRVQRNTPPALALRGWTVNAAARRLGCDFGHLARVLSGERSSKRLLERVAALPDLTN